jgi:hypothetical protein
VDFYISLLETRPRTPWENGVLNLLRHCSRALQAAPALGTLEALAAESVCLRNVQTGEVVAVLLEHDDLHQARTFIPAGTYEARLGSIAALEALEKIVNASYTELRPVVEQYKLDPEAPNLIYGGKGNTFRSHATAEEWALVIRVADWFQQIAGAALAQMRGEK